MAMNSYNENVNNFNQQKTAWENAIHLYKGPDPLEYWYHYVNWYEQNYCYDVSNKMPELLQKTLGLFESYDVYKQDLRLIKIWMKYVDLQQNALNLFQVLYQREIGTQHSVFYISWANHYLRENGFKSAESVINLGFQAKAQPYEDLQSAQQQIATSYYHFSQQSNFQPAPVPVPETVVQQVTPVEVYQQASPAPVHTEPDYRNYNNNGQNNVIPKEKRKNTSPIQQDALNAQLKRHKYEEADCAYEPVPSYGYEENYLQNNNVQGIQNSYNPCNNSVNNSNNFYLNGGPVQQSAEVVYVEQQLPQVVDQSINPNENFQTSACSSNPDSNLNYVISSSLNYVYDDTHVPGYNESESVPPVAVAVADQPVDEESIKLPLNFARSAKNHHNPWRAPLFLEEPPDPNRCCMYAKNLVYPGWDTGTCDNQEMSFEELKALRSFKSKKLPNLGNVTNNAEEDESTALENDTYSEYWVDENQISGEAEQEERLQELTTNHHVQYSQDNRSFTVNSSNNNINNNNSQYIDEFSQFLSSQKGGPVVGQPMGQTTTVSRKRSDKKKQKKGNNRNLVQPINDSEDYEEEIEQSTIRYSCDQSNGNGTTASNSPRDNNKRITIKFRKEQKAVPLNGKRRNGNANGFENNGHSTTTDADLLLAFGNGTNQDQQNYYQENPYIDDSSNFSTSDFNTSYNSSCHGENSNGGFNTEPSTPVMTHNHGHRLTSSQSMAKSSPNFRYLNRPRSSVSVLNDDSMNSMTMNDNSFFQAEMDEELRGRRLQKALETIEQSLAKAAIDPFKAELCKAFLIKLGFPSQELCEAYRMVSTPIPKLSQTKQAYLGDGVYSIEKEVGRGAYGAVYKATNVYTGNAVAIKFQKPANSWELYICNEVKKRITYHDILPGFMDITSAVMAPNGCVLISEFSPYGSLLDINNKIRQSTTRVMHESLVMHFTCQILDIVHYLHRCSIIHADIKPDNFLLMKVPNSSSHVPTLRLIDFGCAIDMNLFPAGTQFKKVIQTDGFTCTEMQEGRPWTYQTDLFCVAGTVHVMLFGDYMQVINKFGQWEIKQKFPRYLKKTVWADFFGKLLNVKNSDAMPNLMDLKSAIEAESYGMDSELQKHIRNLSYMLLKR